MKYEFRAYDQDYLEYYMLNAQQNPEIIKKRKNAVYKLSLIGIILLAYIMYSLLNYNKDSSLLFFGVYAVFIIGYIVFFLNNRYKRFYEKHYKKHIANTIKSELGRLTTIEVVEDKIHLEDESSESKFSITELELIWETPKHFFLKLLAGSAIIIPKEDIKDENQFRKEFNFVNAPIIKLESTEWQSLKDLFFQKV